VPRLSPHFHSREFETRDGTPIPPRHLYWLGRLCLELLEPARRIWGPCTVSSGFRSTEDNARVGGAPRSLHRRVTHRRGAAADVVFARGTPAEWHATLDELGAQGLGLYVDHVHVDNRARRARW